MIEFGGEFDLDLPPERLWDYFTDPEVLAQCAPGCREMRMESPSKLDATLSVGVGSVKPTFDVDVTVTKTEFPSLLEMKADGIAPRNAFEAVAEMRLTETEDGGTTANWTATADVSGIIASLGQRGLGGVTDRLVTNFFTDLEALAREGAEATSRLEAATEAEATLEGVDED